MHGEAWRLQNCCHTAHPTAELPPDHVCTPLLPRPPLTAKPLVQRESLAAPVARGTQAAQLLRDEPAILCLPSPYLRWEGGRHGG